VIGAGAVGSFTAFTLAKMGIGHPHLKAVVLGPIALTAYRDLIPPPAEG